LSAERQAYKNLARQTGADAVEVLAKSDGPARRVAADGGVDNGFRIGIARAADSGAIDSFDQIDDAVRKIEDLDGPANRQAKLLVYDTDGAGVKLVDELDDETLQTVLDVDIDRARELRAAFARNYRHGHASVDDIEEFARYVDDLEGIDGLNSGPVADAIEANDPGNFKGALLEVRVADDIGGDNIEKMNIEIGSDGGIGELDIKRANGKIVEVKSSFGYTKQVIDNQFAKKLNSMGSKPRRRWFFGTIAAGWLKPSSRRSSARSAPPCVRGTGTSHSARWSSNVPSTIFVEQLDTQQINCRHSVSAR